MMAQANGHHKNGAGAGAAKAVRTPDPEGFGASVAVDHQAARPTDGRAGRVAEELDAVSAEVRAVVAGARARLDRMVQQELRGMVEDAVAAIEALSGTGAGPPRPDEPGHRPIPERAPLLETEPVRTTVVAPMEAPSHRPGLPRADGATGRGIDALAHTPNSPPTVETRPSITAIGLEEATAQIETTAPGDGEVLEGTVRLSVKVGGSVGQVPQFMEELCQKPELRLLRLVGSQDEEMNVWVGLREPLHLEDMLRGMEGVASVSSLPPRGVEGEEPRMEVWLLDPHQS